jgi:hypothetical protein
MKKSIINTLIAIAFIVAPLISFASAPPPPPPGGPSGEDNEIGGSAPIGGGLGILLALGAAYGTKKIFDARKKLAEEKE